MLTSQSLLEIAKSYTHFLDQAGSADINFKEEVPKLFANDCKKIVNGKVNVASRDTFEQYFRTARETYKHWSINPLSFHPCSEKSSVTIKYIAEATTVKLFVSATIKVNPKGLVDEISEFDMPIDDNTEVEQLQKFSMGVNDTYNFSNI